METPNFSNYYKIKRESFLQKSIIDSIKGKKENLWEAINTRNINSPSIQEIKTTIKSLGIGLSLEVVIPKILEDDNIFAYFFYPKPIFPKKEKFNIICDFLKYYNLSNDLYKNVILHPENGVKWYQVKLLEFISNIEEGVYYNVFFTSPPPLSNKTQIESIQILKSNPNIIIYE